MPKKAKESKPPSPGQRRQEAFAALKEYHSSGKIPTTGPALAKLIGSENDRGVVIILVSFVEDALLDRLLKRMGVTKSTDRQSVNRSGGPLSNFQSITTLAAAAGMIGERQKEILESMRMIRNACAHSRKEIDFGTPQLQEVFRGIVDPTGDADQVLKSMPREVYRDLFIFMIGGMLAMLKGRKPKVGAIPNPSDVSRGFAAALADSRSR